jgi:hypothetical protein
MIATLANSAWLTACTPEYLRFRRALGRVRVEQERVLQAILRRNEASAFGRRHKFVLIRSARDFQRRVPLAGYEEYGPWVERAAAGEARTLTCEPVRLFQPTGGSAGGPKWIPYTASLAAEFQRGIRAWVADLFRSDPELLRGPAYWSVSPAQESGVTPAGIRVGFADDCEYVGGLQQRLVRSVMAVPASVRQLRDVEAFWYATVRHLVRRRDLRFISVWSPSFLTLLMERLMRFADRLQQEEPAVRPALQAPTAAERHALLWPRLRMISCWTDGNSAAGARRLANLFPQARVKGKGLIATEGFVSLPWEACDGAVLAVRSHFLEFLPAAADGRPDASRPQLAHELEPGQTYSVVLTTGGGFYRYRLGDLVKVTGRVRECPVIRFESRERVVDWCGEKLHEAHATRVLADAFARQDLVPDFAMLAYDSSGRTPGYVLYVECDATEEQLGRIGVAVEAGLEENFHYRYARRLGQLGPVRVFTVRHAENTYLAACLANGQRAGDVKAAALDGRRGWTEKFEGRFVGARAAGQA